MSDTSKHFFTWVTANILGFLALGAMYFTLPPKILMAGFVASTLIISIPIGLAQWIALKRILGASVLWIFTILVGAPIAIFIQRVIPDVLWQVLGDDESVATLTAHYLIIGFAVGLPQWVLLWRKFSWPSIIWLGGSSIGAGAGLWIILVTELIDKSGVLSYFVGILAYSIVTGLTLTGLLVIQNYSQTELATAT